MWRCNTAAPPGCSCCWHWQNKLRYTSCITFFRDSLSTMRAWAWLKSQPWQQRHFPWYFQVLFSLKWPLQTRPTDLFLSVFIHLCDHLLWTLRKSYCSICRPCRCMQRYTSTARIPEVSVDDLYCEPCTASILKYCLCHTCASGVWVDVACVPFSGLKGRQPQDSWLNLRKIILNSWLMNCSQRILIATSRAQKNMVIQCFCWCMIVHRP